MLHAVNWDYSCTRPDAWFNRFAHCPLRPSTGDWYKYSSPQVRIYRCSAFCPSVLYIKSSWAYFWCLDRCTTATVVTRLRCYSDNQEKDLSCTESCLFFFFFQILFYLKLLESTRAEFLNAGWLRANALCPLLPHLPPLGCVLVFPSSPSFCGAGRLPSESVAFIESGLPSYPDL